MCLVLHEWLRPHVKAVQPAHGVQYILSMISKETLPTRERVWLELQLVSIQLLIVLISPTKIKIIDMMPKYIIDKVLI